MVVDEMDISPQTPSAPSMMVATEEEFDSSLPTAQVIPKPLEPESNDMDIDEALEKYIAEHEQTKPVTSSSSIPPPNLASFSADMMDYESLDTAAPSSTFPSAFAGRPLQADPRSLDSRNVRESELRTILEQRNIPQSRYTAGPFKAIVDRYLDGKGICLPSPLCSTWLLTSVAS